MALDMQRDILNAIFCTSDYISIYGNYILLRFLSLNLQSKSNIAYLELTHFMLIRLIVNRTLTIKRPLYENQLVLQILIQVLISHNNMK